MDVSNTILEDVKKYLLIDKSIKSFDEVLIPYIMGSFMALSQMGSILPFETIDKDTTWDELFKPTNNSSVYAAMMEYVCMDCKILFDPPASYVVNLMRDKQKEHLFRVEIAYGQEGNT